MEGDIFNLNNKIYSNNNNILLGIINELHQTIKDSKEKLTIKRLSDIIIKMNNMINENKKNTELIRNDISKLYNQMNNLQYKEIKFDFDPKNPVNKRIKYKGQVLNGVPEGKGAMEWNNGDRYEGEWKNDSKDGKGIYYRNNGDIFEGECKNGYHEGKGIYYYDNGDRYEGDFKNGNSEGKGIYYWNNGNRYEGDFKNDKSEGKGIMYYSNGDREMGD